MRRRVLAGLALVTAALVGWALWAQPDLVRTLWADETPAAVRGDPVPAIEGRPTARIAVVGDTGTGDEGQQRVADQLAAQHRVRPFDALVILGDLIYPDGDADLVEDRVLEPYAPLLDDGVELVPVLGNHDYESREQLEILEALGRKNPWYAERIGAAWVLVLDSMLLEDEAQTAWLADVLDDPPREREWTIVALHHPPYSAGFDGSDLDVRDAWSPLFAAAEVPLVLAGHDHDYQRSKPQDGVTYVVSGGGANPRRVGTEDFTAVSTSTLHLVDLLVYPRRVVGRAVDDAGQLVDEFVLKR